MSVCPSGQLAAAFGFRVEVASGHQTEDMLPFETRPLCFWREAPTACVGHQRASRLFAGRFVYAQMIQKWSAIWDGRLRVEEKKATR